MSQEITALVLTVEGKVVTSNFATFAESVRSRLAEINRDLKTDEDFDQAANDAKLIAGAEADLKAAKEKALADAEELHALFQQIDSLGGELAKARLELSKAIDTRKEEVKREMVEAALARVDADPDVARRTYLTGLKETLKGKRNLESMKKALDTLVACHNACIGKTRELLKRYTDSFGQDSLPDWRELEVQNFDAVNVELRRRIDLRRANDEAAKAQKAAADALAEAAKAKRQQATQQEPQDLPWDAAPRSAGSATTQPVASDPGPSQAQAPEAHDDLVDAKLEFDTVYKPAIKQAAEIIREAKKALRHARNIEIAEKFSSTMNLAWREANQ